MREGLYILKNRFRGRILSIPFPLSDVCIGQHINHDFLFSAHMN